MILYTLHFSAASEEVYWPGCLVGGAKIGFTSSMSFTVFTMSVFAPKVNTLLQANDVSPPLARRQSPLS